MCILYTCQYIEQNKIIYDTIKKINLYGHYGYYREDGEIGIITDSAMAVEYSQKDTTYIHGDTLEVLADKMCYAYVHLQRLHKRIIDYFYSIMNVQDFVV